MEYDEEDISLFSSITSSLNEGVIIIDGAGIIQAMNDAVRELFGYESSDLVGKDVRVLMPPEHGERHGHYIRNFEETGVSRILDKGRELEGRHRDGQLFPLLLKVNRFEHLDKFYYLGVVRSLASEKKAARLIDDQRLILDETVKTGKIGFWTLNTGTGGLIWSSAIHRIHGTDKQDFNPDIPGVLAHYPKDQRRRILRALNRAVRHNSEFLFESSLLHPDGTEKYIRCTGKAYPGEESRDGMIVGIVQDITEETLIATKQKNDMAFLQLMMDSIPDLLFVKDEDFRIIRANESFMQLYPPEKRGKIIGTTTLEEYEESEADLFLANDRLAFQQGISEAEESILFPNGEKRTLYTKKVRFYDDNRPFILGVGRDITERKQLESQLEKQAEQLKQSNQDLTQFAYAASHDLQEPLRAVSGCAQILQRRYTESLDDKGRELIHHMVDGVERMSGLISDLLTYSRSGTQKAMEQVDCNEVLATALRALDALIREKQAKVVSDELPVVPGNEVEFKMVLQNLIGNALKYNRSQTPIVTIHVKPADGYWLFTMEDNGIGIDERYHSRIFEVFQRLHTRDEFKGTGIGLALCKKIIDRLGGRIWVESDGSSGSTFNFTIPEGTVRSQDTC